jgi:hypothetical protein
MMDFSKPNAAQYESAHMQSLSSPTNIDTRDLRTGYYCLRILSKVLFLFLAAFTSIIFFFSACFGSDDPNGGGNDYAASKMMLLAAIMVMITGIFQSCKLYAISIVTFFSAFAFGFVNIVMGYIIMSIFTIAFLSMLYQHFQVGKGSLVLSKNLVEDDTVVYSNELAEEGKCYEFTHKG